MVEDLLDKNIFRSSNFKLYKKNIGTYSKKEELLLNYSIH